MRKHLVVSLFVCAAAGLLAVPAGCTQKADEPEPVLAPGPVPLNSFVRGWQQQLDMPGGGGDVKELHVRENAVFAYTRGGSVVVMARDGGGLRWVGQIRSSDRGGMRPPVVLEEHVVIPTSSTLEVFEPTEGAFVRSVPLGGLAARSNAVGGGTLVYLGGDFAGAGRVVAVDITRQSAPSVWQLMIPKGGLASTPALYQEVLFIGGGDGNVYAVAADNRDPLWPLPGNVFRTEGPIVGDVAADDSGVYVASTDSRLYVLNRGTGRLVWQYHGGRPLTVGPTLAATAVYLPVPNAGVAAFRKGEVETGNPELDFNRDPLWLAAGMTQFLAEDERHAYLRRGKDNAIVAVDKNTGEQLFENHRRDLAHFATNSKPDGVIFAATATNRVLAIKPVLRPGVVGELVWNEFDPAQAGGAAVAAAR